MPADNVIESKGAAAPPPPAVRAVGCALYFLPVKLRMPLKFGKEISTHMTCARVKLTVADQAGRRFVGWGETPLSANWAWPGVPGALSHETRLNAMKELCVELARAWAKFGVAGHAIEVGHAFLETALNDLIVSFSGVRKKELRVGVPGNAGMAGMPGLPGGVPMLAALVCASAFDIALHDAYGQAAGLPVYQTYNKRFMRHDLAHYLEPADGATVNFAGKYPEDFLVKQPAAKLIAWHLVGGLDPLDEADRKGDEPADGYPVTLVEWIERDGLKALKIKLRGTDAAWDYDRLVRIGHIAVERGVDWLTADFNCTVTDPEYVNAILDRLRDEHPRTFGMLLYVEQPFPYELAEHPIDVRSVSARKPLFMDESAHDWTEVRRGRGLGWTGVALKTCKTQTGALLSLCWARAHGMTLMVQDLTNPMLAQVPHVLLAAHAGTIMGVESNGPQFLPEASLVEARVHPGLYTRRNGMLDASTLRGAGFGYRVEEIGRELPAEAAEEEAG